MDKELKKYLLNLLFVFITFLIWTYVAIEILAAEMLYFYGTLLLIMTFITQLVKLFQYYIGEKKILNFFIGLIILPLFRIGITVFFVMTICEALSPDFLEKISEAIIYGF